MRRGLSLIISVCLIMSICSNFAYATDYSSEAVNLWDLLMMRLIGSQSGSIPLSIPGFGDGSLDLRDFAGRVASTLDPDTVCSVSDDKLHHASSLSTDEPLGEDGHGKFAVAVCKYCGHHFKVYGQDVHDAYDNYLTDNNLNNGLSGEPDGGLIWYPTLSDFSPKALLYFEVYVSSRDWSFSFCPSKPLPYSFSPSYYSATVTSISSHSLHLHFVASSSLRFAKISYDGNGGYLVFPIDGSYSLFSTADSLFSSGSVSSSFFNSGHYSSGYKCSFYYSPNTVLNLFLSAGDTFDIDINFPVFRIVPDSTVSTPSIPSTITINNNDYSVKDFNFSTRTYNVTNESGDDITVTYNDDNYTVTNNTTNTTNNYYYYITNNSGDDSGGGGSGSGGSGKDYTDILTQIRDLCAQILEKIGIGGGSGGDNPPADTPLPVDIPDSSSDAVDPQKMPDFLFNFSNKFLFINDIYQITLQLVRDITNDKFTAYNYPDGVINLPELKSIHVPAPDQPAEDPSGDGTSPSGGSPSGPGGSITGVSVPTAPAVSFMFPEYDFYGFNFGGYAVLDFSWYAPYKSRVDGLLSGFLWAGFLWLLFKRLPGIIHGSAMAADTVNYIDNASSD